jgi:hypothetical protein
VAAFDTFDTLRARDKESGGRMPGVKRSRKVKRAVLDNYRRTGRIDQATAAAGVDRTTHYVWLKHDEQYRQEFEDCAPEVAGLIEDALFRRAFEGVEEPVFAGGKRALDFARDEKGELVIDPATGKAKSVPASIRRLSDACALAIAAARIPAYAKKHRLVDGEGQDRDIEVTVVYDDPTVPE